MPTKKIPSPPAESAPQSINDFAEVLSGLLKTAMDYSSNLQQIALLRSAELEKRIAELENVVAGLIADVYQEARTPQEYDVNEGLIINITQVAKVLGVSRPTVYRLIESGALPAKKLATGSNTTPRTFVLADDLKTFLANLPSAEGQPAS